VNAIVYDDDDDDDDGDDDNSLAYRPHKHSKDAAAVLWSLREIGPQPTASMNRLRGDFC